MKKFKIKREGYVVYDDEFKKEVMAYAAREPCRHASRKYEVPNATLRGWLRSQGPDITTSLRSTTKKNLTTSTEGILIHVAAMRCAQKMDSRIGDTKGKWYLWACVEKFKADLNKEVERVRGKNDSN